MIETAHIDYFETILNNGVFTENDIRIKYSKDHTEDIEHIPAVVLKPNNTEELSKLLRYCNEHHLPVTPIGALTGLSGGAIPQKEGIAISMERFNSILDIHTKNAQVTTEPFVITEVLQSSVAEKGLFYPPDPASKGSCTIGGNVSENSGGPKAVKYGVTSDYVINLEIVLTDGTIMWTGANVLKNATGYNLTQLIVGSEGTLAIITKIVLKLIPLPSVDVLMLIPFNNRTHACEAVAEIINHGITPSGLEFMERDALLLAQKFTEDYSLAIGDNQEAHLLLELDGHHLDILLQEGEKIFDIVQKYDIGEILFADSKAQKDRLWKLRRSVGEAVKASSIYKEEDTVVPRYELPGLVEKVKALGQTYGFKSICYGHAGDGNLHINILKEDLDDVFWNTTLKEAIRELFEYVKSKGGTISGEHGIGLVQKEYLDIVFTDHTLNIMKSIKGILDPNNILNPGKIFDIK